MLGEEIRSLFFLLFFSAFHQFMLNVFPYPFLSLLFFKNIYFLRYLAIREVFTGIRDLTPCSRFYNNICFTKRVNYFFFASLQYISTSIESSLSFFLDGPRHPFFIQRTMRTGDQTQSLHIIILVYLSKFCINLFHNMKLPRLR